MHIHARAQVDKAATMVAPRDLLLYHYYGGLVHIAFKQFKQVRAHGSLPSRHAPCTPHAYTMHTPWIYHGYTMHTPCIYHGCTCEAEEHEDEQLQEVEHVL